MTAKSKTQTSRKAPQFLNSLKPKKKDHYTPAHPKLNQALIEKSKKGGKHKATKAIIRDKDDKKIQ